MTEYNPQSERLGRKDVEAAYSLIKADIHQTPIFTSTSLDTLLGSKRIFFKGELFQKTGSFKYRGACHALAKLTPEELEKGVITHSSGNHGAALAAAAKIKGAKCYVIMVYPTVFRT
jgi:threonine dehydratase